MHEVEREQGRRIKGRKEREEERFVCLLVVAESGGSGQRSGASGRRAGGRKERCVCQLMMVI